MLSDLNSNLSFLPLLIVIVDYGTAHLTIGCLRSLVEEVQAVLGTRVAVVDNASGDNSVELIQSTIETEGWKDWVSRGCMMIRHQVFEQIGLMDEEYFLYYEEMNFCLQAQRAGGQYWYIAESRIVHLVSYLARLQ